MKWECFAHKVDSMCPSAADFLFSHFSFIWEQQREPHSLLLYSIESRGEQDCDVCLFKDFLQRFFWGKKKQNTF